MRLSLLLIILIVLMVPALCRAESQIRLTLNEAIKMAIDKNLDVKAEYYNPAQYEADVQRNRAIYDPMLSLQGTYSDAHGASGVTGQTLALNSSLSQLLWSGGTAALTFNNSNSNVSSPVYYWQTGIGASFSQPLLKNIGREATEIAVTLSRTSKFASLEKLNGKLLATIAQVRNEYYKLYSLREDREVKKVSLELARKILVETKARVAAGVLPAMEILNAEFGVVTREKELIDAELSVINQVDVIKVLLQLDAAISDVFLVDAPVRDKVVPPLEGESVARALDRPDVREQKRNLEYFELQIRNLSQKTRPDLTFTAAAQATGLDNSYQRNWDKVLTFDYPIWSVGLKFDYPLGNNAAENDYRKSRLKAEQAALQLRSIEENVAREVKGALRALEAGYKQIEVADRSKAFADERLRAFMKKSEVGMATAKDVLDVENDLALAKSNQIKALVGYANALTTFWQTTGELMDRERIRVVEGDADKIYSGIR